MAVRIGSAPAGYATGPQSAAGTTTRDTPAATLPGHVDNSLLPNSPP